MKFLATNFVDYVIKCNKGNLHKELQDYFNTFNKSNIFHSNLIFYGPTGVGKYTQALDLIKKFSPTNLKYERKINFNFNKKHEYVFRISDIHFEIDMELLGCNAKALWNDIYYRILDIIAGRSENTGIILCKNFHKIHSELLDNFYSYMQSIKHRNINISYIILTEQISFFPQNILSRCHIIPIKRPTKQIYNKILKTKITYSLDKIVNIKDILTNEYQPISKNNKIVKIIYQSIKDLDSLNFLILRDNIYNIFIYQLDLYKCLWDIIKLVIKENDISEEKLKRILIELYNFLKLYNNNYRPIYHLEKFILYLCKEIHDF